ncbi:Sec-independent protein translocase family protein [Kineosporia succinea]|uniref:Sec-independent protein translocase protein TatB n=1 Tax=Kineosporia succinea TaxID=84632 RepID=A0ABT9NYI8_9ACTN|nr:Sec-independent protein translocase TatB [Kineosporia succinea]MDP9825475.1 sec-independent protein translocase protein TatB [Kineosporia succinea]
MFGINPAEFIVLVAVAAVVLGPERLPQYAQGLARIVVQLRNMAQGASRQVREELGPEFDDIDWQKLDPRQYDPRRIVREALADSFDPDDPLGLKQNGYTKENLTGDGGGDTKRSTPSASSARDETRATEAATPKPPAGTPAFDPDAT